MKKRKIQKRFLLPIILAVTLCCASVVGATLALFTSETKIPVEVTPGFMYIEPEFDTDSFEITYSGSPVSQFPSGPLT